MCVERRIVQIWGGRQKKLLGSRSAPVIGMHDVCTSHATSPILLNIANAIAKIPVSRESTVLHKVILFRNS